MDVQPLACPACQGPVPLADAEAVACPYCGASVPIPENLRSMRRDLTAYGPERRAAQRLYRRLGKAPPRFLRAFTFFESRWFWFFGAGFWIALGIAVLVSGVPWVGAVGFHVNTWDVLTDRQRSLISVGGTLGSIVVGLLLAGWSHKRVVSRRGLQSALAAAPPHAPGGPARCRSCGAALVVAEDALGSRCDYCRADNLVQLPADWVARTRGVVKKMVVEKDSAIVAEAKARSSLRWSLFWRLFLGGGVTCVALLPVAFGEASHVSIDLVDVYKDPNELPEWSAANVPHFNCTSFVGFTMDLVHCRSQCQGAYLVALRGRRPVHVVVRGDPPPAEVELDGRHVGMLSAVWRPAAGATPSNGEATLVPPLSGWYRLRIVGSDAPSRVQFCITQE